MILGIGTDITDIKRIKKLLGAQMIKRCFTPSEQEYATKKSTDKGKVSSYAKRFAAKEACAKALGCGIGKGARFDEIECIHNASGMPKLVLHGAARQTLNAMTPPGMTANLHLSLSDEKNYALAFVTISATSD